MRSLALLVLLGFPSASDAAEGTDAVGAPPPRPADPAESGPDMSAFSPLPPPPSTAAEAAALLSRYPAGALPVEPAVMGAIGLLGDVAGREDLGLLRSLARREGSEIRGAAARAIDEIVGRAREAERVRFAAALPTAEATEAAAASWRARGLGAEQARCAGYADLVLGQARTAPEIPPVEAEDRGETRLAVRGYTHLAARGDEGARAALSGFGVDTETLLLGLLARGETEGLEVLVRSGGGRTVSVLAERVREGSPSERVIAADALARMTGRGLPNEDDERARRALSRAAADPLAPVREIAENALRKP